MTEKEAGGIKVDICEGGCGGLWFDKFEFKKFDEPHESAGEALLDIDRKEGGKTEQENKLGCPKCSDIIMRRNWFSPKKQVVVDECPACAGIWLDVGELGSIRSLYKTEDEKKKAAEEYFGEVFGRQLAATRHKSQQDLTQARRFANMFRFLCPSAYIPGKQDGGAF